MRRFWIWDVREAMVRGSLGSMRTAISKKSRAKLYVGAQNPGP